MSDRHDSLPSKKISSVVSLWWKERVEKLIESERPEDAKLLYLEFEDYTLKSKRSNE